MVFLDAFNELSRPNQNRKRIEEFFARAIMFARRLQRADVKLSLCCQRRRGADCAGPDLQNADEQAQGPRADPRAAVFGDYFDVDARWATLRQTAESYLIMDRNNLEVAGLIQKWL